jgi:hypothetical protein
MLEPNITRGQIAIDPRNGVLFYKDGSGNLIKTTLSFNQDTYTDVSTDDVVTFSSNVIIDGNLTVNGDTVTINTTQLYVEDNIIILNSNIEESATPTLDAGIEINRGNLPNVSIRWNETLNRWEYTNDGLNYSAIDYSSIALGANTSGDYVQNLVAGTGITLSNNSGEGSEPIVAIGQDVSTSATPTFARVIAPLTGNVTGTVSDISNHTINELSDVVISEEANGDFLRYQSGSWINDAVNLATDTIGNYVENLVAGTGVTITNNSGEGATPNISIGQAVGTTDTVTFNVVNADLTGDVTGTVSDISNHGISDLSDVAINNAENGDFLRYNGSNWINDPVNLTEDTVGDYVATVTEGTGIAVTNTGGEGATPNIALDAVLDNLNDVAITTPLNGQVLEYDGTVWVNTTSADSEPIGHEDKSESVISFDEETRTFSIAPVSTSFTVWCAGKRFVKTATETVEIPDTSGLYYIYFNSSGVLSYRTDYFVWDEDAPTAYVYWNEVDNKAYFFADERHGITLDWATHEYLHRTRGAAIANGFGANNYIINGDGSLDSHAKLDIANGTFFDEDLQVDISHSATPTPNTWEQVLQGNAEIPVFYRLNNHWTKDVATEFPLKQGASRPQYNLNTAGTWSATDIANNRFGVSWIIATNNLSEPIIAVLGQGSYTDNGSAQAEFYSSLNLDGFPIVEFRPLYKIIYECKNSYTNTPSARITDVIDLRSIISSDQGVGATAVSDHGSMTGLADDDHTQYLRTDGTRTATSLTVSGSITTNSFILDGIEIDAATPSDTNVLKYDAGLNKYVPGVASTVASLDDLTDVVISGATPNQVLKFNGTNWVNAESPSGGSIGSAFSAAIGDGSEAEYIVTHNLSTRNVVVSIAEENEPYGAVSAHWEATDLNNITIYFASPPASDSIRVNVYGAVSGNLQSSYAATIGIPTATSYVITHNLGTRDIMLQARNIDSPYESLNVAWEATTIDTATVYLDSPPAENSIRIKIIS